MAKTDKPTPTLPAWPAALRAELAAAYLDISTATLARMHAGALLPSPLKFSPGCVAWVREELDAWLSAGAPNRESWRRLKQA
jgi:predicted DNA-binding transcriptional regulator AlpA